MKKSQLRRKLSQLEGFSEPKVELEQYTTPPELAADLLHAAYMRGDIEDRQVVDLGTGTGVLAIGAALAGGDVTAVEKDSSALEIARRNAEKFELDLDFVEKDIRKLSGNFETCVMNPPFSVHSELGEEFFRKAFELADSVYSVAPAEIEIRSLIENTAHSLEEAEEYSISLPPTYGFHTSESEDVRIKLLVTGS